MLPIPGIFQKQIDQYEYACKYGAISMNLFFNFTATQKLMDLAEKYEELKTSGGLEKYMKKKRKKNAVRDRKSLKSIK